MKKLFSLFVCLFIYIGANAQISYTPFFRDDVPLPTIQLPEGYRQERPKNYNPTRKAQGTATVVKNCVALLPDGEDPIIVSVHIKKYSDSICSFGFVEPTYGTFYMFGNSSGGLEKLVPTRLVDPSMAKKWPYYVVFNTNAGQVICFLPNLNVTKEAIYNFENLQSNSK